MTIRSQILVARAAGVDLASAPGHAAASPHSGITLRKPLPAPLPSREVGSAAEASRTDAATRAAGGHHREVRLDEDGRSCFPRWRALRPRRSGQCRMIPRAGMRLTYLSITNFRNLDGVEIPLAGSPVVVGENRVGKTNLVHAIRLVLDPSLSNSARWLQIDDFSDHLGDDPTDRSPGRNRMRPTWRWSSWRTWTSGLVGMVRRCRRRPPRAQRPSDRHGRAARRFRLREPARRTHGRSRTGP
jgi:hypothetical protein